jgi:hypothetical protein
VDHSSFHAKTALLFPETDWQKLRMANRKPAQLDLLRQSFDGSAAVSENGIKSKFCSA